MTDAEFIAALESCTLPAEDFGPAARVRAGYLYLRLGSFDEAIDRTGTAIRRYATSLGQPDRYHETITVGFLALIRQRICERGDGGGWPGFASANPDMFERDLLLRYFPRSQLDSPLARKVFVLPQSAEARS